MSKYLCQKTAIHNPISFFFFYHLPKVGIYCKGFLLFWILSQTIRWSNIFIQVMSPSLFVAPLLLLYGTTGLQTPGTRRILPNVLPLYL